MKLKFNNKQVRTISNEYAKNIVRVEGKSPTKNEKTAILSVSMDYTSGYIQGMKDAQVQVNNFLGIIK